MSFCDILKGLRQEKGVTQYEVATACSLTPTCICQLETGARNPTGSTVAALAKYFNCSADYLLELEDDFGVRTAAPSGDNYSTDERQLIDKYRVLNPHCKKLINNTIDTLVTTSTSATEQKKRL